ncbi:hypothetical protein P691DRAFT_803529 [Macrolepiota fuliginosa MF-IS2]|uniref:Uncharacterized protein n=1 Tax=Macrolepiota fuliginosa MF-IS2 TaxID=1400762 RepID=A0A9P5X943_9AGAR|nr:hypothetical protein P691DRAFT_803529 [Macrolepiota fuliginosa MF-IS2]
MASSVIIPQVLPNTKGMPPRIPRASHRHAAPSGPWPWADIDEDNPLDPRSTGESHNSRDPISWTGYPTSLFRNWTAVRLEKSGIAKLIKERKGSEPPHCVIYYVDVNDEGRFSKPSHHEVMPENEKEFWCRIQAKRPDGTRIRAIFIENMSGPVMQMLGTKYRIEPFFFSSSLNWIPSRYQEENPDDGSDHITIVLNFLRAIDNPTLNISPLSCGPKRVLSRAGTVMIDTQAPLSLCSSAWNDKVVLIDVLALHMVRHKNSSTVITYHPPREWHSTSARILHSRFRFAGQSVYWRSIFSQSDDPTFVLLSLLWHALYAWDEALETLYAHICWLETEILVTNDVYQTRELHVIRASLLHYTSLLEDFKKAVLFVQNTPSPTMLDHPERQLSMHVMDRECNVLVSEIDRLEMFRKTQDMRLENLVNLAFNNVNFQDSQDMRSLTEATLRDSAVMKQISYLTMVFLPASFAASVFGMNIENLTEGAHGKLVHYVVVAVLLTAASIWVLVALHNKHRHEDSDISFATRLQWPVTNLIRWTVGRRNRVKEPRHFV